MKSIASVMSTFNKALANLNKIAVTAEAKAQTMVESADNKLCIAEEVFDAERAEASDMFDTAHKAAKIATKIDNLIS
jgi:hypothetical protein